MKYDCTEEFDLSVIFDKLTSRVPAQMVAASEFFNPRLTLTRLRTLLQEHSKGYFVPRLFPVPPSSTEEGNT